MPDFRGYFTVAGKRASAIIDAADLNDARKKAVELAVQNHWVLHEVNPKPVKSGVLRGYSPYRYNPTRTVRKCRGTCR